MENVSILIVEDEPIIAADLAFTLRKLGYQTLPPLSSGEEALEFLAKNQPDLVLLDVQLDGNLDGIDTAHRINAERPLPIIFLTSNADPGTFSRAKLTQPHAFLSKPFREADLRSAIGLALAEAREAKEADAPEDAEEVKVQSDRIFLKVKDRLRKIMFSDIRYVEADRYYCWVFTQKEKYLASLPMKKLAANLPGRDFVRVSRSHVVNLQLVDEISDVSLVIGTDRISIGKSYRAEVMKRFLTI